MPISASMRLAKRASVMAGLAWCSSSVPARSRKASSIEIGSTSGVNSCISRRTWRPTATYFAMSGLTTDRLGAGLERLEHRHGRAHAIGPGDIAGGRDHPALAAADDHRLVQQGWVVALLDGRIERVAIDMRQTQGVALGVAQQPRRAAGGAAAWLGRIAVMVAQAVAAQDPPHGCWAWIAQGMSPGGGPLSRSRAWATLSGLTPRFPANSSRSESLPAT